MSPEKIIPLIAAIESVIAEIKRDVAPESEGGKKLTPAEAKRVGRRLLKAATALVAVLL